MYKLIAFDPGGTTGYARFRVHGTKPHLSVTFEAGNIPTAHLDQKLHFLSRIKPEFAVIEKFPGAVGPKLVHIADLIKAYFPNYCEIMPGEWKPVTGSANIPARRREPFRYTQHEKDAINLGRFWLRKELGLIFE
jgi:hypothetical protein